MKPKSFSQMLKEEFWRLFVPAFKEPRVLLEYRIFLENEQGMPAGVAIYQVCKHDYADEVFFRQMHADSFNPAGELNERLMSAKEASVVWEYFISRVNRRFSIKCELFKYAHRSHIFWYLSERDGARTFAGDIWMALFEDSHEMWDTMVMRRRGARGVDVIELHIISKEIK